MPTSGNDLINGTPSGDSIDALAGNDYVAGLGGNDTLDGGAGSDTLDGGADNDILRPGVNASGVQDFLFGGLGIDTLDLTALGGPAYGLVLTLGPAGFYSLSSGLGLQSGEFTGFEAIRLGDGNELFLGGAGNDSVDFGGGNDWALAGDGADTLDGGAGSDTLDGDGGNDIIRPGVNASGVQDFLTGGSGADTLDLTALGGPDYGLVLTLGPAGFYSLSSGLGLQSGEFTGFEVIRLGDGNELFLGGGGNDSVDFGGGNDWAVAGSGADSLAGGTGNDTLDGDGGNDQLFGGNGDDVVYGDRTFVFGDDVLDLGAGDDYGWGGQNNDTIVGGTGNDTLIGDPTGSSGADALRPGGGVDFVDGGGTGGGAGDYTLGFADTLFLDDEPGSLLVVGATSGPTYTYITTSGAESFRNIEMLELGAGNDTVYVGFDPSGQYLVEVRGGGGNDFVIDPIVGSVARVFVGAGGDDTLIGSVNGSDTLTGGDGNDFLNGGTGLGGDVLDGGDGRDTMLGGDGFDLLTGGGGNDVINGGAGRDTVSFLAATVGVAINLPGGWASSVQTGLDVLSGIEGAVGGSGADTITGAGLDGELVGNAGNDFISAGAGGDRLIGGDGADTLVGGASSDTLRGDDGIDFIDGGGSVDQISFFLDSSGVQFYGNAGFAVTASGTEFFTNIEEISGSRSGDTIVLGGTVRRAFADEGNDVVSTSTLSGLDTFQVFGDQGDDTLSGDIGLDALLGQDGNDFIAGGDGADTLDGGAGADTIDGGGGGDDIYAGDGVDFLRGGAGADTFYFNQTSESAPGLEDAIADFDSLTDRIDLSSIDADTNLANDQAFTFIGAGAFTNVAGQLRVVAFTSPNYAIVAGDVDGDGVADFRLIVYGEVPVASDFIL